MDSTAGVVLEFVLLIGGGVLAVFLLIMLFKGKSSKDQNYNQSGNYGDGGHGGDGGAGCDGGGAF